MAAFRVTYEVVTHESAEHGDAEDRGYYSRGGWKHDDPSEWTLAEVISEFGRGGFEDSGSWFTTVDARINYATGAHTTYGVHPPNITPASYARIRRILCGR